MDDPPVLTPTAGTITTPAGVRPVEEVRLGGLARSAAVILTCGVRPGDTHHPAAPIALATCGYEIIAAELGEDAMLTDDALVDEAAALITVLRERGWKSEQIGLIGYRLGGRAALLTAGRFRFGAAISVGFEEARLRHPATGLRTPWLGLCAGPVPTDLSARLRVTSAVHTELVDYGGVVPEFWSGSSPAAYAAGFDAWQRVVEWLDLHVAPRPSRRVTTWASLGR